jgi:hypothetical protein
LPDDNPLNIYTKRSRRVRALKIGNTVFCDRLHRFHNIEDPVEDSPKDVFMRKALIAFSLLAIFLGGCANDPAEIDISGIWINQVAIDAAAKGQPLLKTLWAYGPNQEWDINTKTGQAQNTNGFEIGEGKLIPKKPGAWTVDYGYGTTELRYDGKQLIQMASENEPEQFFDRPKDPAPQGARWGTTFERVLYSAYMGANWKIIDGPGKGNTAQFQANGQVTGLPNADRYSLCLAGDCNSMRGGHDSMVLAQGSQGGTWIFVRKGKQLEILQAINESQPDEIPYYIVGPRQWLLEKP